MQDHELMRHVVQLGPVSRRAKKKAGAKHKTVDHNNVLRKILTHGHPMLP